MDEATLEFPLRGIDRSKAFVRQTGETTSVGSNIRSFERLEDRRRGGSRPGLIRWLDSLLPGSIQGLGSVAATGEQFALGYFPFQWPDFVLDPVSFGPVRNGGTGHSSLPKITPRLDWTPAHKELLEDQAFVAGDFNAAAHDPRDNSVIAGTYSYSLPLGTIFGHRTQRVVNLTFTPTDTSTFRVAQASFTFKRNAAKRTRDETPPVGQAALTVFPDCIVGGYVDGTAAYIDSGNSASGTWSYSPPAGSHTTAIDGSTLNPPVPGLVFLFDATFTPTIGVGFTMTGLIGTVLGA
jgi:hypothetical protein